MSTPGRVRIGELSRRTGVSVDLLRVWERRYGLLAPERTGGGQRLYSTADEQRIRAMRAHLDGGVSPAEAARLVTSGGSNGATSDELARALVRALDDVDEVAAHAVLDRMLAELGLERALTDVLLPYLRELGNRWACGEVTVAEEHFASRLLHGRLLALARGWDSGNGPRALLACPPGEAHDLPLISFGVALRRRGWRITYLGASTPIGALVEMARELEVRIVVLAATTPVRFADVIEELRAVTDALPLAIAGEGATERIAAETGARLLAGDPVTAAYEIARAA